VVTIIYGFTPKYFMNVVKEPHLSTQIYWQPFLSVPSPNLQMSQFIGFHTQQHKIGQDVCKLNLILTRKLLWAI